MILIFRFRPVRLADLNFGECVGFGKAARAHLATLYGLSSQPEKST